MTLKCVCCQGQPFEVPLDTPGVALMIRHLCQMHGIKAKMPGQR